MAKYGKYKSIQEILEAKQGGVRVTDILEGVIENIQTLRKEFKKPKSQRLASNLIANDLRENLMGLNAVYKQLKRNKNLN